ncbi:hypothetical protein MMC11_002887 [Xylographa trunciseda]|nr:hypothetical protein [Xylographa trunciseda]
MPSSTIRNPIIKTKQTLLYSFMQSYKLSTRLPQVCKVIKTPVTSRNMSFFGRVPQGDFAPLFRLLDDYDDHRSGSSNTRHGASSSIRAFQPRFDVREEKESYLLNGELPGIDQKDVSIEFTDNNTLVIKGRTEREYSSGTPAIEGGAEQGKITEAGEGHQYHKATVEDESTDGAATPASGSTEVVKHKEQPKQQKFKYWVSERSVGEFHRSFTFPGRVDQDAVKASLKNGILSVVVPKAHEKASRKISIE